MKVLFVATVVKTHIMEFHIPYLKMLKDEGWETAVAARNDYKNPSECSIPHCDKYYDIQFERNPFNPRNLSAYKQLKRLIDKEEYDIIHCHTPVGGVLTRLAARKARKKGSVVVYTAHGFHFYKGAPLVNWILYYPVERLLARVTDVLLTINKEDYRRAGRFKAGRVEYVPGVGIDMERFHAQSADPERDLRAELGIPDDVRVLLSVGEVNKNKNHRLVIEALPELENVWYVVCGSGPLMDELKELAVKLSVNDRVIFAGYRNDLSDFYHMADCFVFPSYREGLPVALMEAMASGLVCVASRNRGTNDLLNGSMLRFDASDKNELLEKLQLALFKDCSDDIKWNYKKLKEYDISNVLGIMKSIYFNALKKKRAKECNQ